MYTLIIPQNLERGKQIVEVIFANGSIGTAEITCNPSGAGRMIMRVEIVDTKSLPDPQKQNRHAGGRRIRITEELKADIHRWIQENKSSCEDIDRQANVKIGTVSRLLSGRSKSMNGESILPIIKIVTAQN